MIPAGSHITQGDPPNGKQPQALASGHGRYTTATPERVLALVVSIGGSGRYTHTPQLL
jgi:hypothetical protein